MKALLNLLLRLAFVPLTGIILVQTYGWFILTKFPSLPHFTWLEALGVAVFVSLFMTRELSPADNQALDGLDSDQKEDFSLKQTGVHIFMLGLQWLSAFLIHLFL